MTFSTAAGIDFGRDWLDVAIATSASPSGGRHFRIANTPSAIAALPARLRRAGVERVVRESIGATASRLVHTLAEAAISTGVVDPRRIRALRLVEGRRAKTDRLDAGLIARFARLMTDVARPVPSHELLGTVPVALTLSSARRARPSKGERGPARAASRSRPG